MKILKSIKKRINNAFDPMSLATGLAFTVAATCSLADDEESAKNLGTFLLHFGFIVGSAIHLLNACETAENSLTNYITKGLTRIQGTAFFTSSSIGIYQQIENDITPIGFSILALTGLILVPLNNPECIKGLSKRKKVLLEILGFSGFFLGSVALAGSARNLKKGWPAGVFAGGAFCEAFKRSILLFKNANDDPEELKQAIVDGPKHTAE